MLPPAPNSCDVIVARYGKEDEGGSGQTAARAFWTHTFVI